MQTSTSDPSLRSSIKRTEHEVDRKNKSDYALLSEISFSPNMAQPTGSNFNWLPGAQIGIYIHSATSYNRLHLGSCVTYTKNRLIGRGHLNMHSLPELARISFFISLSASFQLSDVIIVIHFKKRERDREEVFSPSSS